jgi:hypothetical protein
LARLAALASLGVKGMTPGQAKPVTKG